MEICVLSMMFIYVHNERYTYIRRSNRSLKCFCRLQKVREKMVFDLVPVVWKCSSVLHFHLLRVRFFSFFFFSHQLSSLRPSNRALTYSSVIIWSVYFVFDIIFPVFSIIFSMHSGLIEAGIFPTVLDIDDGCLSTISIVRIFHSSSNDEPVQCHAGPRSLIVSIYERKFR